MVFIFVVQWLITVFVIIGPLYFLNEPTFLCPKNDAEVFKNQYSATCKDEAEACKIDGVIDPN